MMSEFELANQIIGIASNKANSEPVDFDTKCALVELTECAKAHAGSSAEKLDASITAGVQTWSAVRLWAEAAKASIDPRAGS